MAKKKNDTEQVVPVIVEPATPGNEPVTPHTEVKTVEQYKEGFVAKFDTNKANIKKLEVKLKKIEIDGIGDKKNYDAVATIKKDVATLLRTTEERRVALKEPHLRSGQAIDGYAKELESPLRELKSLADSKLKAIDDAKEVEKKRKETEAKEALDARVSELKEAGIVFDGAYYSIGESIALDLATIGKFTDKQYAGVLGAVKAKKEEMDAEAERLEAERLEQQRLIKEQQEEIARRQEEQDKKDRELKARMDEFERKEREQKAREKAGRERQLAAFSLSFVPLDAVYKLDTKSGKIEVTLKDLLELTDALWDDKMAWVEERAAEIKELEVERKRLEDLQKQTAAKREAVLLALGFVYNGNTMTYDEPVTKKGLWVNCFDISSLGEDAWAERLKIMQDSVAGYLADAKAIQDKQAADAEERRKAGLSDFQKVEEYLENFKVDKPVLLLPENQAFIDAFSRNVANGMEALIARIIK